ATVTFVHLQLFSFSQICTGASVGFSNQKSNVPGAFHSCSWLYRPPWLKWASVSGNVSMVPGDRVGPAPGELLPRFRKYWEANAITNTIPNTMTSKMAIWIDCFFMAATRKRGAERKEEGGCPPVGRGARHRAGGTDLHCNGVPGGVKTAPRHG